MVLGSGIRIRDPGSGIRKKPILDPGSRGQKAPNPGSRIRIRNTAKMELRLLPTLQTRVPDSDLDGSLPVLICVAGFPDPDRIPKTDQDPGFSNYTIFLVNNINENTSKTIFFH
jgi:hypothetical protein